MTRNNLFLFLFLSIGTSLSAQHPVSKKIEGRVFSEGGDVAATHVMNVTQKSATITDVNGYFAITVQRNDTLVFSAIQFKKKAVVVTQGVLESKFLQVPLEDALTELDEVIVKPYNLSGDMAMDLEKMEIEPVVTASTLGLPNAYVKLPTQAERELYAATANPFMSFDPLINAITGRTKMLKERIKREEKYNRTLRVRAFYADSLYRTELRIPEDNIADFMYFCEVDPDFQSVVDSHNRFKIWEFMRKKSIAYRENYGLE